MRWARQPLALLAASLVAVFLAASGSSGPTRLMDLQDYSLGDGDGTDYAGQWYLRRDHKGNSRTPGEAVRISGDPCLQGYCIRLSILGPDTNNLAESVGNSDYHAARNIGQAHDGDIQTYQWSFRLGQGFPTSASEGNFLSISGWHATGFDAPGHPLTIRARRGVIGVVASGWNPNLRRNGRNLWKCNLVGTQKTGVWYTIRIEARWDDVAGYLKIRLDDPTTGPGWDGTCIRNDGQGTLFRDPGGVVDVAYMTHNLHRSSSYKRPMTIWFDNTIQDPNLPDPYAN